MTNDDSILDNLRVYEVKLFPLSNHVEFRAIYKKLKFFWAILGHETNRMSALNQHYYQDVMKRVSSII